MTLAITSDAYKKLFIPFSFVMMMLIVYVIDPSSFLLTWKGRAFYLFFLWLFALEFILGSRNSKSRISLRTDVARIILGFFALMIPTIYVLEFYLFGLNNTIVQLGEFLGAGQGLNLNFVRDFFPISFEYIIVAVSIFVGVLLLLDFEGIKQFSISISLLGMIGVFYMIDTFRPYQTAVIPNFLSPALPQSGFPIQSFVPFISSIVAFFTQKLGYAVQMVVLRDGAVQMLVNNSFGFVIYWPCAGVYSLFIYTFVILLFLKNSPMSLRGKMGCFIVGVVGTFFVNILRIVAIISITVNLGDATGQYFHNYYGELFFLVWIVVFLFALILVQRFLIRRKQSSSSG